MVVTGGLATFAIVVLALQSALFIGFAVAGAACMHRGLQARV